MKNLSLIAAFLLLGMAGKAQISANFISKTKVCNGVSFTLTANCLGANAYRWLVDGNLYSKQQDTTARFFTACADQHTITLVALNTLFGTSDTITKNVTVIEANCAGQTFVSYEGCFGDTVILQSHPDAVTNLWSFSEPQEIINGCTTCDYVKYRLTASGLHLYNIITYDGGCKNTISYNHTGCTEGWLAIGDVEEGSAITIAPNPVSDKATLRFHNNTNKKHTFTLYDVQGRIVRQIENITGGEMQLIRDDLSAGSYFYHLSSSDGTIARGKVFIQ